MRNRVARGAAAAAFLILMLPIPARGERPPSGVTQDEAKLAEELDGLVHKLREERVAHSQRHRAPITAIKGVLGNLICGWGRYNIRVPGHSTLGGIPHYSSHE